MSKIKCRQIGGWGTTIKRLLPLFGNSIACNIASFLTIIHVMIYIKTIMKITEYAYMQQVSKTCRSKETEKRSDEKQAKYFDPSNKKSNWDQK